LAESIIGLYKTELIGRRGPRRCLEYIQFDTLEQVRLEHWQCDVPARPSSFHLGLDLKIVSRLCVRITNCCQVLLAGYAIVGAV
jgi:hypothetical protein